MQEGAGVRQLLEDELRRQGKRLRDLNVELVLGLQESVKSAVQAGYGATFISRRAVEAELASGALAEIRVDGLDLQRQISIARAAGRVPSRAAEAFVSFARDTVEVIVRWGLDELVPLLAELGIEQPFLVASARWDGIGLPAAATLERDPVASHRGPGRRRRHPRRRRRQRDRHGEGRVGGERVAARVGADDVLGRGVDGLLRRSRPGQAHGRRRPGRDTSPASSTSPSSRSTCPVPSPAARR